MTIIFSAFITFSSALWHCWLYKNRCVIIPTGSALLQVTFTGKMAHRVTRLSLDAESSVSYLPLSHAAAQLFDIFIPIVCGVTMYFAQPDALKVRTIANL